MDQLKSICDSCGAPARGLICEHCGKPTAHLENAAAENRALDEYHELLQKLKPEEQRLWLESGFIPDSPEVLIEAGIYCLPFLKNMALYEAAASRLEAVILKLKLMPGGRQTRQAVEDFQAKIEEYKSTRTKDNIMGAGCLLLILAAMVAVSWWLVWDAGLTVAVPLIILMVVVVAVLILRK
jgi:hypothetical protein